MIARAVIALAVATLAYGFAVASHANRVFSDDGTLRYQVTLSREALAATRAAEIDAIWRQRLRAYRVRVALGSDPGDGGLAVTVEVGGAAPSAADRIARALDLPGAVSMRAVRSNTATAKAWYTAIHGRGGAAPRADGVDAWPDSWADRDGREYLDYFVVGPSRAAIAGALAELGPELVVPDDLELMYEDVIPHPDDEGDRAPYVRTYLVERAAFVTQADIADAAVAYDANTLRPEVAVSFTRAGGVAFGDATERLAGEKIAIVVDGRVMSAPIVMGAIRGGRSTITMGGGDARTMEAEAAGLVAALAGGRGSPPLPAGIQARLVGSEAGTDARVLTGVVIALLAGALAWFAAPVARRAGLTLAPLGTPGAARRPFIGEVVLPIAATIGLPLVLIWIGRHVLLPGLTEDAFMVLVKGDRTALSQVGIFALGIMPLVSAFWLTELIALAVPCWRRARLGTPADRRAIDLLAIVLTIVLALLQSYFILQFFDSLGARGDVIIAGGTLMRVAVVATLVGGVLVHVVAAELISRHGLANGVLVLLGAGAALMLWSRRPHAGGVTGWMLFTVLAAIAVLAAITSSARAGRRRLPWAGVVPIVLTTIAIGLLSLPAMAWPEVGGWIAKLYGRPPWLDVAIAIAVVAVVVRARRADAAPVPVVLSIGFVLALFAAPYLVASPLRPAIDVIAMATLGVAALELVAGVRARLRLAAPAVVASMHDVDRADRLAAALGEAGIDHAVLGVHARAILRFLGAYCPIVVQVAGADAERARAIVTGAA